MRWQLSRHSPHLRCALEGGRPAASPPWAAPLGGWQPTWAPASVLECATTSDCPIWLWVAPPLWQLVPWAPNLASDWLLTPPPVASRWGSPLLTGSLLQHRGVPADVSRKRSRTGFRDFVIDQGLRGVWPDLQSARDYTVNLDLVLSRCQVA